MITSLILLPLRVCTDTCACTDNDYELKPNTLEGMHRHVCADNDYELNLLPLRVCTDTCAQTMITGLNLLPLRVCTDTRAQTRACV